LVLQPIPSRIGITTTNGITMTLQNWRFIAVRTPEAKARLRPIAWYQPAITEAAVTFIVCGQFVPMAVTAVYSATKAAIHSYALSQRFLLKDTKVRVLEIAPPWARTDLMNSREAKEAMPLDQFIAETMRHWQAMLTRSLSKGPRLSATTPVRTNMLSSTGSI